MLLDTLFSDTADYYYVLDSQYDASGRLERLWLGGNAQAVVPEVVNDYHYNAWTVVFTADGGWRTDG